MIKAFAHKVSPAPFWVGLAFFAVFYVLAGSVFAACRPDRIELHGPKGRSVFTVELAQSAAERSWGLMNRHKMPQTAGMLFIYPKKRDDIAFWMKNTYIPLDIIFINDAGRVLRVYQNARPHDQTLVPGGPNIQFVLEINAGLAKEYGIGPGTLVRHPAISDPVWRC